MRIGGGAGIGRAQIRGRLVGRPLGRAQFSLVQQYDYDENSVYQFGAQSFEANVGVEPQLSSHISVLLKGGGGLTALAGVDSEPLVPVDIPLPPEDERGQGVSEGPRTYDYGPGTNFSGSAAFRYDGRAFAVLYYQANHVYVVDGVRANHFLQRMGVDLLMPLLGSLGLGVSGEYLKKVIFGNTGLVCLAAEWRQALGPGRGARRSRRVSSIAFSEMVQDLCLAKLGSNSSLAHRWVMVWPPTLACGSTDAAACAACSGSARRCYWR